MAAQAEHHPFHPHPDLTSRLYEPTDATVVAALQSWDADIRRASAVGAARLHGSDEADDIAQEVRVRVFGAIRAGHGDSPRYLRRVIRNAVITFLRRESRAITTRSRIGCALDDEAMTLPVEQYECRCEIVSPWLATLPVSLQRVYQLLYEQRLTQDQAALVLRVSQPRVSQLHAALLRRGRLDIAALAA